MFTPTLWRHSVKYSVHQTLESPNDELLELTSPLFKYKHTENRDLSLCKYRKALFGDELLLPKLWEKQWSWSWGWGLLTLIPFRVYLGKEGAQGGRDCLTHQTLVCWQTGFPDDNHRLDFLAGDCRGFSSSPPGQGHTDKYNKKSLRREARPNPLHSGRDPWLLILPKGQLCRNVLFAFLLSVNICTNLEGVSPVEWSGPALWPRITQLPLWETWSPHLQRCEKLKPNEYARSSQLPLSGSSTDLDISPRVQCTR